jgi:DNA-binding transcriptional MerR regulator
MPAHDRLFADQEAGVLRIGVLASRTGVSVRALRYYEEQHLLVASRTTSGHRQYPDSAIERVQIIQRLFAAGLTSRAIAAICPVDSEDIVPGTAEERLAVLLTERVRIDEQARAIAAARDQLDAVIAEITSSP